MKFQLLIKTKMLKTNVFLTLKLSDVVFILLINVKMPTIVLSMKFQLLIEVKMLKNKDFSPYKTLRCIYYAHSCMYVSWYVCVLLSLTWSHSLVLFACVDALSPSQQFFSHVRTFPDLNQY